MAKKVPVTVFVDPEIETALTIKPFAAGLATKAAAGAAGHASPEGITGTATGTNLTGAADVDADADYSG